MYVLATLFVVFFSWSYQSDVALNLYDFIVRRPNKLTEKYGLRAYDEIILAPMVGPNFFSRRLFFLRYHPTLQCLFEPRVIEFDHKRENFHPIGQNVTEEITGQNGDAVVSGLATLLSCQNNL